MKKLQKGPVLWLAPMLIILIALFVYPTLEVLRYSFTNMSLLSNEYTYTLGSYIRILTDSKTLQVLAVTVIFVFFSVLGQTFFGLIVALAITKGEDLHLRGTVFVRVVSLVSWAIPGVIIGVIWKMLLNESDSGILTYFLHSLGVEKVVFLTSGASALSCAIIANIWRGTAQSMILSYAGLKTISKDILEAADIDGASSLQRLTYITLPSIISVISINVVLNTIATFNTFDMVMALTGGGPGDSTEVLALTTYNQIFKSMSLGQGSAYAILLLVINGCMAMVYFAFLKRRGDMLE